MKEINILSVQKKSKNEKDHQETDIEIQNKVSLDTLKSFMPYNKIYNNKKISNDIYEIQLFDMKSIKKGDIDICFQLVKDNLEEMYKKSSFGWSSRRKRREMTEKHTKYIIARKEGQNDIVGFLSYQIVIEAEEHVIARAYHRSGIGYHLMNVMENLALKLGFQKTMLTVFNFNTLALCFYRKMGLL
ncbi:hypothetical protein PCANB_001009 [Pneumocystis canis]|nr:hypothetical protein PCANB_001009 [Pneumocystis canis]